MFPSICTPKIHDFRITQKEQECKLMFVPALFLISDSYSAIAMIVAFRAKCKIFSRHLQKPILKTEKGRFKGL